MPESRELKGGPAVCFGAWGGRYGSLRTLEEDGWEWQRE